MDSWTGSYVARDLEALQCLPYPAYLVLRYLCARADEMGRCFPTIGTIADGCRLAQATVYKALELLEAAGYVVYLRRAARDVLTGKPIPNVYMISPFYLYVRDEAIFEMRPLWEGAGGKWANPSFEVQDGSEWRDDSTQRYTNQQQNQQQESTTRIHHQKPTTTTSIFPESEGQKTGAGVPASDGETGEKPPVERQQQRQRSKDRSAAAAPASRPAAALDSSGRKRYPDPEPVTAALDDVMETAAKRVAGFGIPLHLARGFVCSYGLADCEQVAAYVSNTPDVRNPAGMFRALLQRGVVTARTGETGARPKSRYADVFDT